MNVDQAIKEAVARELAPLLASCEEIRAQIDATEGQLPTISDRHERAAARVDVMMRRAKLNAVISELRSPDLIKKATRLARERWPSWRI